MEYYIERDKNGKITGLYANPQSFLTGEKLTDTNEEVKSFQDEIAKYFLGK